jgi:hypothetical protein
MESEYRPFLSLDNIRERTVQRKPLELLNDFVTMDVSHIDTLDGLSEETERIRQALNAIITHKGEQQRISNGSISNTASLETFEIERMLPGDGEVLLLKTDGEYIHIDRHIPRVYITRDGGSEDHKEVQYVLEFPVEKSFMETSGFGSIRAMRRNNPGSVTETIDDFLPTCAPESSEVQQGFAVVLQQSLRDLQAVL